MSFHFYLCRAAQDAPPIVAWPAMLAEPLDAPAAVRSALSEVLPSLRWSEDDPTMGQACDAEYGGAFYVHLVCNDAGQVCMFSVNNRASPATLAAIMDRFGLNYCCTEFGDLRQPHRCDADWRPLA